MMNAVAAKARSITITVNNRAWCNLTNIRIQMDCGYVENHPPYEIEPGKAGVFNVCSKGGLMGVEGCITY